MISSLCLSVIIVIRNTIKRDRKLLVTDAFQSAAMLLKKDAAKVAALIASTTREPFVDDEGPVSALSLV